MYQSYAGQVLDGKPVILEKIKLPENARLVITIIDDLPSVSEVREESEVKTLAQKQNEALKQFSAAMKEIDDEPLDEEFWEIINRGVIIDSGVDL